MVLHHVLHADHPTGIHAQGGFMPCLPLCTIHRSLIYVCMGPASEEQVAEGMWGRRAVAQMPGTTQKRMGTAQR